MPPCLDVGNPILRILRRCLPLWEICSSSHTTHRLEAAMSVCPLSGQRTTSFSSGAAHQGSEPRTCRGFCFSCRPARLKAPNHEVWGLRRIMAADHLPSQGPGTPCVATRLGASIKRSTVRTKGCRPMGHSHGLPQQV